MELEISQKAFYRTAKTATVFVLYFLKNSNCCVFIIIYVYFKTGDNLLIWHNFFPQNIEANNVIYAPV